MDRLVTRWTVTYCMDKMNLRGGQLVTGRRVIYWMDSQLLDGQYATTKVIATRGPSAWTGKSREWTSQSLESTRQSPEWICQSIRYSVEDRQLHGVHLRENVLEKYTTHSYHLDERDSHLN